MLLFVVVFCDNEHILFALLCFLFLLVCMFCLIFDFFLLSLLLFCFVYTRVFKKWFQMIIEISSFLTIVAERVDKYVIFRLII